MKVALQRIVLTEVEADVPDACPECGADFKAVEMNLVEESYVASSQGCFMSSAGDRLLDYDVGEFHYEADIVVGYQCRCGHVLASTEGAASDPTDGIAI
ncbi:MAG: hypothetical protein V4537_14180 [Pseudomonadota bacterium]